MRGQIHVPAALLVTSLTGSAVDPTADLDFLLPCHTSILPTDQRAVLHDTGKLQGLGLSNVRQVRIEQLKKCLELSKVRLGCDSRILRPGWD